MYRNNPTVNDVINELGEAAQSQFISANLKAACERASQMLDTLHALSGVAIHCTPHIFLDEIEEKMKGHKNFKEMQDSLILHSNMLDEIRAIIPQDCLRDGIVERVQHLVEERRIASEREIRLSQKVEAATAILSGERGTPVLWNEPKN